MWKETYLENQIFTASPVELIRMLYRGAIDFIGDARRHLAAGEIVARVTAIGRAQAILDELNGSLDQQGGSEISRNLAALYTYMRKRLTDANLRQEDEPMAEVVALLETLREAWDKADASAAESPSGPAMQFQNAGGYAPSAESHLWSA